MQTVLFVSNLLRNDLLYHKIILLNYSVKFVCDYKLNIYETTILELVKKVSLTHINCS